MNELESEFLQNIEFIETKHKCGTDISFYFRERHDVKYCERYVFEIIAQDMKLGKKCGFFEFFHNKAISRRLKQLNPRVPEDKIIYSNIEVYEGYRERGLSKLLVKNALERLKDTGYIHVVRFFDEDAAHAMAHQFAKRNYRQINNDILSLYKSYL